MSAKRFDPQRRGVLIGGGALLLTTAVGVRAQTSHERRVIVIGGALAETIYALGAQDGSHGTLVGADTTCTYPAATRNLPKVGYQRALSTEGLLSLRPDLVLASAEAGPPSVLDQVKQAGVEVVLFAEHHDVDTVRGKIDGIAKALDADAAGRALRSRFDDAWQGARASVDASSLARKAAKTSVLFVMNQSGNQAMVAGQNTAADAMLRYAGVGNAMQGFNGYRPLSPEALVAAAPDIVLTTDEGVQAAGGSAAMLAAPGFATTPAGRASRIVSLDALFLLGFGPRLPAAVTTLNQRLANA
ncbi:hemin ABC transporter substrate-binding protein [Paraburkholderia acidicola]|uniref:Hemin ABC transporter substrate-binding protein n=1 Tax=Paraburkholderia acidicola TaxID=1912599 RepID=A0A2A4F0Q0_9BURK|nr:helical backbone metal receptor [Paraburkholderia acidicola]PCE25919.1 hemin ABC transporter substrate-binding protein [Paraburkholderia acidicola]